VGEELIGELKSALEKAGLLAGEIQAKLNQASGLETSPEPRQLTEAREDIRELSSRLVDSEHQVQRLMNLYVATYQLHGSLEPATVTRAIGDVVTNLLGAESFAIVLRRDGEPTAGYEVAVREGSDPRVLELFGSGSYLGGDEQIDATLIDDGSGGDRRGRSGALAVVPLRVEDRCVGVLAVYRLLKQKPALGPDDREMLDLLSAHAASALLAARLFAEQDRRLKTLESLVRLAQGR
jgi:GAF domain-containing protein